MKRLEPVATFRGKRVRGHVLHGDALARLRTLNDGSISLVFLDPPFNLGKTYGRSPSPDRRPEQEYSRWLFETADEAARVVAPGGALFLYHLPAWALRVGARLQETLELRHWIAVSMKNGFVRGRRLYPAHYALLYFTKGEPLTFRRPRLTPDRCRKCGTTLRDYGGYWPIIEQNGLNLTDVWTDLSPVRHRSTKTRTANELPIRMTDRIVAIAGRPGGTFLDPFCGSGAAVASAAAAGMRFTASDKSVASCRLTVSRLRQLIARRKNNGQ